MLAITDKAKTSLNGTPQPHLGHLIEFYLTRTKRPQLGTASLDWAGHGTPYSNSGEP
ncbi:MAG: hypothetical protein KME25_15920 [Symplocastrum torsivum CPER-KK1]|uniref:Uncharacterized protein n=1 Tax=Symplocastrum torsivum CPER-KK1 TaxID=450513 RepID=A0A951PMJ5_9CYAN|nr:hypothetical protein [Symplocastrum torsivum CPER-KK1]